MVGGGDPFYLKLANIDGSTKLWSPRIQFHADVYFFMGTDCFGSSMAYSMEFLVRTLALRSQSVLTLLLFTKIVRIRFTF